MMIRTISLLISFAVLPVIGHAEKLSLDTLSHYLNQLQTATAGFTQINDDGTTSTGTIYIKRPGRMRFEYNPPNKALVLASAGEVAIFDPKGNESAERYPLKRTPLSVILAKKVDLARADMVVAHAFDGSATVVTAQDPEHPEYGNIQLHFTGPQVELRQWVINDDSGSSTTVVLHEMKTEGSLPNRLFNIESALEIETR